MVRSQLREDVCLSPSIPRTTNLNPGSRSDPLRIGPTREKLNREDSGQKSRPMRSEDPRKEEIVS